MVISFLLKKGTNTTPYSPISYFEKENNPPTQPCAFIIPYYNLKQLKTLNNLTTLEYPSCNFLKLRLPHTVVSVWFTRGDQLRAIQLNKMDLKSLVIHGNSHLHHYQNQKPHVRPNQNWLELVAKINK